MKIGILGTGMVGRALGTKLVALGHDVMMGSRTGDSEAGEAWRAGQTGAAATGSFAAVAAHGEIVILAVRGDVAVAAVELAGAGALAGKVLVSVSNPLDFSQGFPPHLIPALSNTTSLAEAVQRAAPGARVVNTLNTMNASVMVDPGRVPGAHDVFVCGDDAGAKAAAVALLQSFGWTAPIDLGPLAAARGTEAMMPVWLRLFGAFGHTDFNYHIARGPG